MVGVTRRFCVKSQDVGLGLGHKGPAKFLRSRESQRMLVGGAPSLLGPGLGLRPGLGGRLGRILRRLTLACV